MNWPNVSDHGLSPASSAGDGGQPVTEEPASEHRGGVSAREQIGQGVTRPVPVSGSGVPVSNRM